MAFHDSAHPHVERLILLTCHLRGSLRRPEIRGANPLIVGTFGLLAKPSLCRKTCGPLAERQLPHSLHLMEVLTSMVAQAVNSVLGVLAERQLPENKPVFFIGSRRERIVCRHQSSRS